MERESILRVNTHILGKEEMMLVRPMEVYKYKSVSTRQDFERLRDIILNNHIYMPSPLMLNDPMEANAVVMSLGIMGSGYISACGKFIHLLKKTRKI